MKVNLFLLDRITGEHVYFIFVMNFGKFVLYFCCYFWIFYSSLKGEFDIFSSGVFFSSYNGSVRLAFGSWETKNLVSIFVAVNYAQNRLYYSPLSSN